MKKQNMRNQMEQKLETYIPPSKRKKHQPTQPNYILSGISEKRLREINNYLRNAERGRLPMSHDGADVTRPITGEQLAKFLRCPQCLAKPVVFIPCKKDCLAGLPKDLKAKVKGCEVGVCIKHWVDLAPTVIGWSGGPENEKCSSLDFEVGIDVADDVVS